MNLFEYGRALTAIGKNISDISASNKEVFNLPHNLSININVYRDTVHKLKKIEAPAIILSEHLNLIDTFERLITAYSHQLESVNADGEEINTELFQKGRDIVEKETQNLISILVKTITLAFNKS